MNKHQRIKLMMDKIWDESTIKDSVISDCYMAAEILKVEQPDKIWFYGSGQTKAPSHWKDIDAIQTIKFNEKKLYDHPTVPTWAVLSCDKNKDQKIGLIRAHKDNPYMFLFHVQKRLDGTILDWDNKFVQVGSKQKTKDYGQWYLEANEYIGRFTTGFWMTMWLLAGPQKEIYISGFDGHLQKKSNGTRYKYDNGRGWNAAGRHSLDKEWVYIKKAIEIARARGVKVYYAGEEDAVEVDFDRISQMEKEEQLRREEKKRQEAAKHSGIKINLGPGKGWKEKYNKEDWQTVDCYHGADHDIDFRDTQTLPYDDNTVSVIFCSHMIEHISNEACSALLKECYRVLKPGGVLRLSCPDLDKAYRAYQNNDTDFFNLRDVRTRGDYIEHRLVGWFASFGINRRSSPHTVDRVLVKQAFHGMDKERFLAFCRECIPNNATYIAHVNGYWWEKLRDMLLGSGFNDIRKATYWDSEVVELRQKKAFDNRGKVSLYVESVK